MVESSDSGMDSELERLLEAARDEDTERLPGAELDTLFSGVQSRVHQAESQPWWWWKSRSTLTRRGIALGSFVALLVCTVLFAARPDLGQYPFWRLGLELGSVSVLVLASLVLALRPLHQPTLPPALSWSVLGVSLVATFVLAILPPPHADALLPEGLALHQHAAGCMYFGLLAGLPVYAIVRLLDRGPPLTAVVAAAAAGLVGNVLLALHCPVNDPVHNLWGHFSVAVIFGSGIAILELLRSRRRR